jgi:hypothetical protein
MNFSSGQVIFALSFLIVFIVLMVFAYKKDAAVSRIHYKGAYKVLVAIAVVFVLVYGLIRALH